MIKTTKKLKNPAVKSEPAKVPVATPSAARTEPAKSEIPKTETAKVASPGNGSAQTNGIRLELVKPEAKKVSVAGSFNGWKPEKTPLTPVGNGRWVGNLTVNPGRYEYLFVVDGQWLPDPNAKEAVQNPFGGKNSVLIVSA